MKLAYLGPEGTYSEQAAIDYAADSERIPYSGIPAVVKAAESGEVQEAIVPIENSLEGAVTYTVDLLIHESPLKIRGEIVVPIHHQLLMPPGVRMEDVRVVYSHPQAIAQCRGFLSRNLPIAEHVASLSTASAVEDMKSSRYPAAAISSRRAAELFNVAIAETDIEDIHNNLTRFVVLGAEDGRRTGKDKTSICFDFSHDAPGTLYNTLGELAQREINMIKIESRPDRRSLGKYVFLIDMDGHREDPIVSDALDAMKERAAIFKIFGSYPKAPSVG
ncbi:MAG: prephenate dehydratase [Dehalococcoidia bacterium]|nr:prephenate dehydratase [Dehalococcoidia bacterium]